MPSASAMSRKIEYRRLESLTPDPRNPKGHEAGVIDSSVGRFGFIDPIVEDRRTGRIISGHGRTESLRAAQERGDTPPDGVRQDKDGAWLVPVVVGWASRSDTEAAAALIALNRSTELGGWEEESLLTLLDELIVLGDEGLAGVGFDQSDIDDLRHRLDSLGYGDQDGAGENPSPKQRSTRPTLPLDAIMCVNDHQLAMPAFSMGWQRGLITSAWKGKRIQAFNSSFLNIPIVFMDNEWHDYNHADHVEAVAAVRPKYATVRDIVTKEQASAEGVAYYDLSQTLAMAEEVAPYVENVILIPKFDCLDRLPETIGGKRVVLGYSVRSSYGGTPMPAAMFAGRPVHLLGGSWKRQRRLLELLGTDVVSLDHNQLLKVATVGTFWMGDGTSLSLSDVIRVPHFHMHVTVALGAAMMMSELLDTYGVAPLAEETPDPGGTARAEEDDEDVAV